MKQIKPFTTGYTLLSSARIRHIGITISREKGLIISAPSNIGEVVIQEFLASKSTWIQKTLVRLESLGPPLLPPAKRGDYARYKQRALELAAERVAYWNQQYGCKVNSIHVRNQKTRWGSCSRNGNLNFNYKIALLPQAHADYIIVHEICHLKEMNHSPKFWALVEKTVPNHRALRRQLRTNSVR